VRDPVPLELELELELKEAVAMAVAVAMTHRGCRGGALQRAGWRTSRCDAVLIAYCHGSMLLPSTVPSATPSSWPGMLQLDADFSGQGSAAPEQKRRCCGRIGDQLQFEGLA
jgi:hypothetical protein